MAHATLSRRAALGALGTLALLALPRLPALAAVSADEAADFIREIGDQTLNVLRDDSLSQEQTVSRLEDLLSEATDLELVAKLVLGRHRRTASEEQVQRFVDLFEEYGYNTLARQISFYDGQTFEVTGSQAVSDTDAVVNGRINMQGGRPPVNVDFRVRNQNGDYKIIDVIGENISLVITQRDEFNSLINREGFDGMLAEFRQRIEEGRGAFAGQQG